MARLQATIPNQLNVRLEKAKELTGLKVSEMIRNAVTAYLKGLGV